MAILIVGRHCSGKTTLINSVSGIFPTAELIEVNSAEKLIEYLPKCQIILVDTPLLQCLQRATIDNGENLSFLQYLKMYAKEEKFLEYVTELPNHTIIKNDKTLADFRVQIKKLNL